MKRFACVSLLLLAACPPQGTGPGAAGPSAPGASCPAASDVMVASYLTQTQDEHGGGGHTGWVLPLAAQRVTSTDGRPDYAQIQGSEAVAQSVPPAPPAVWLMLPGQQPCRAAVGSYYAAVVESSVPNLTYGVELTGCAPPPREQQQDAEAIAIIAEQAPTDCQILTPQPIAERMGETDAQKQWQRPTKQTPLPPAFAAALPPHDCQAPGCETLWAIAQVQVGGKPVAWSGAVNWLTIPADATPASQCSWKADTFAGFFLAGPDGRATKVTEGQDHPLVLAAVLADRSGPRALIAEGAGEYTVYDLSASATTAPAAGPPPGQPGDPYASPAATPASTESATYGVLMTGDLPGANIKVARHLVWLMLSPDAYAVDEHIGPQCEEPAAH